MISYWHSSRAVRPTRSLTGNLTILVDLVVNGGIDLGISARRNAMLAELLIKNLNRRQSDPQLREVFGFIPLLTL